MICFQSYFRYQFKLGSFSLYASICSIVSLAFTFSYSALSQNAPLLMLMKTLQAKSAAMHFLKSLILRKWTAEQSLLMDCQSIDQRIQDKSLGRQSLIALELILPILGSQKLYFQRMEVIVFHVYNVQIDGYMLKQVVLGYIALNYQKQVITFMICGVIACFLPSMLTYIINSPNKHH